MSVIMCGSEPHIGCLKSISVILSTPFDVSLTFNTPSFCKADRNLESYIHTKGMLVLHVSLKYWTK